MTSLPIRLAAIELLRLAADWIASDKATSFGALQTVSRRLGIDREVYYAASDAETSWAQPIDAPSRVASLLAAADRLEKEVA
jgi:hypothetical protein